MPSNAAVVVIATAADNGGANNNRLLPLPTPIEAATVVATTGLKKKKFKEAWRKLEKKILQLNNE